jgi:hypothetical protein
VSALRQPSRIALLVGLAVSGIALAHDRVSVLIGAQISGPEYYPAPYYYRPVNVELSRPTTYIERSANDVAPTGAPSEALEYWDYYLRYREQLLRPTSSNVPPAGNT